MISKLSQKDIRALKIGAVAVAAIIVFLFALGGYNRWNTARQESQELENQLGIKEGETTPDMAFSLETVACIGACGLAPNIVINRDTYGHLTSERITEILADIRAAEKEAQEEQ